MSATSASSGLAPVWPGPSLVVPMTIDCLLVGTPDRTSTWAATGTNYANLFNGLQATAPFTPGTAPTTGAHLTWTLPYSLRQGQGANGSTDAVQFPLVPNRWAVLRARYDGGGNAPALTAWVIQADLLSPWQQTNPNVSQYPDPNNPGATVQIGGAVPMAQWTGAAGPAQPFLRAVGPGDVSWAVAYDNIRNALSFHDDLSTTGPGTIAYAVTGWYADPTTDPLRTLPTDDASKWLDALSRGFNWTTGDATVSGLAASIADWNTWRTSHGLATMPFNPANVSLPAQLKSAITSWAGWRQGNGIAADQPTLPTQLLCHGFIGQIAWQGTAQSYGTGAPGGGTSYPTVAAGNTAVEATAAWLANQLVAQDHLTQANVAAIEQAIVAFQKGLLHDLGTDPASTEAKLQATEFSDLSGGAHWTVVRATAKDGSAEATGDQTIPLTDPQTAALTTLAALQTARNRTAAILLSQQKELFSLLFKQSAMDRTTPAAIRTQVNNAVTVMRGAAQASSTDLAGLDTRIGTQKQTLIDALGTAYELREIEVPSAHQPADPVLLVAAAGADTKFAAPGVYDTDAALVCRFTGETIGGIEIAGPSGQSPVAPADLLNSMQLPQGLALPKEIQDLWLEMLFLDPGAASFLARTYFTVRGITPTPADVATLAGTVKTQQAAVWRNAAADSGLRQMTAETAGFLGTLPSPVAVVLWGGQPWSPIYLDWKFSWIPSSSTPAGTFSNWQLGSNDYTWLGGTVQPLPKPLIYQGRTVLNAKIARDIGSQFAQFTDGPDYADLPRYVRDALGQMSDLLKNADLLTQSLGGFTEQLVTKVIAPNQTVTGPDQTLLGNSPIGFQPVPGTYTANTSYFPFRAGHAQLLDLWVVDSYGQILRGKDPSLGQNAPVPNLILAQTITTPGDTTGSFIQLPPRIAQPSSGGLTLLDAEDDSVPSNSSDETSSICGWVMPNHLDISLMVFDADGTMLGSVIEVQPDVVGGVARTGLRWDLPPGSDAPLGSPPAIPNPHLRGVVQGLLTKGLTAGGAALDTLMNHIDSTLWLTAPLGVPKGGVSMLLGPPIAVVRGQLGLSLAGLPSYDQSWLATGASYVGAGNKYQPVPVPLQSVPVGIRVGDQSFNENGVLGYFTDDDYSRFYAVHGAGTQTAAVRVGMRQSKRGLRALVGAPFDVKDDSGYVTENHLVPVLPDGTPVKMTIFVDPRGSMPVVGGLLPPNWQTLPNGPVARALSAMKATFRVGPLLVADPASVRMPLPAEMRGQWSWTARTDVTTWRAAEKVQTQNPIATFDTTPPRLSEGWLVLSGALGATASAIERFRLGPSRGARGK